MGIMTAFKARSALLKHQKGQKEEAFQMYEELYAQGVVQASYMLPYAVLLLREGGDENFIKVKEVLVKAQNASDLSDEKRRQLLTNYSVACWKLGEKEKAIETMEAVHRKYPCGLVYQTLGYLYVEMGDAEKALAYNLEALEYDDEDSIVLDNLGQLYYRLLNDKEQALTYFQKANKFNPKQIDTLYFLSRYDIERGKIKDAVEKLETALLGNFSPLNYLDRTAITLETEELKKKL